MSMRVTEAQNYKEERNSIAYEYISFFEQLGYFIVLIPNNSKNIEQYFNLNVDLVVLSGGNNINPKLYNNDDILEDIYNLRDDIERSLVNLAIQKDIKILGICRGFHFINIFFNGSLTHNIKNHVNKKHILNSNNSILNTKEVNSFHNQAILESGLASQLTKLAVTNDDIIEAFISQNKNILGVQWHPERQEKQFDKKLINQFLKGTI